MGLFSSKQLESWEDLFVEQIQDLYDAEKRLTKAIPKMAEAASSRELKNAFQTHHKETEGHVSRLEEVFGHLGRQPATEKCDGIKGLISEGDEMVQATGDSKIKDAALIAAAQRVEHYEIGAYGTARELAELLGHAEAAKLLQMTLNEEKQTDKKLTQIAEHSLYPGKAVNRKSSAASKSARSRRAPKKKAKASAKTPEKAGRRKALARSR